MSPRTPDTLESRQKRTAWIVAVVRAMIGVFGPDSKRMWAAKHDMDEGRIKSERIPIRWIKKRHWWKTKLVVEDVFGVFPRVTLPWPAEIDERDASVACRRGVNALRRAWWGEGPFAILDAESQQLSSEDHRLVGEVVCVFAIQEKATT